MTDRKSEIYPAELDDSVTFYVEFSQWPGKERQYRLFQRNYIHSKEDLEKYLSEGESENEKDWMRMQNEGHPYQLLSGEVCEFNNAASFNTEKFLKFTVDSLNKNSKPL